MIFHVIDKRTGLEVHAKGFWAITQYGRLVDVIDGWNCEGGGGSDDAPLTYVAVIGPAPRVTVQQPKPEFQCPYCHKVLSTEMGRIQHIIHKHQEHK